MLQGSNHLKTSLVEKGGRPDVNKQHPRGVGVCVMSTRWMHLWRVKKCAPKQLPKGTLELTNVSQICNIPSRTQNSAFWVPTRKQTLQTLANGPRFAEFQVVLTHKTCAFLYCSVPTRRRRQKARGSTWSALRAHSQFVSPNQPYFRQGKQETCRLGKIWNSLSGGGDFIQLASWLIPSPQWGNPKFSTQILTLIIFQCNSIFPFVPLPQWVEGQGESLLGILTLRAAQLFHEIVTLKTFPWHGKNGGGGSVTQVSFSGQLNFSTM